MNKKERQLAFLCAAAVLLIIIVVAAVSSCRGEPERVITPETPKGGVITVGSGSPAPTGLVAAPGESGTSVSQTAPQRAVVELAGIPARATADPLMVSARTSLPLDTTTTTTTTTTVGAASDTLMVTTETANVRTDAGADFPLVTVIKSGEHYKILDKKDAANGVLWYRIRLSDGRDGWVCCSYVAPDAHSGDLRAYLTFDDGPSGNTTKILDILDRYHVKATFFVIYHPNCESIYKEIVKRGHTIALHSYSHEYGQIYCSEEAYFKDLNKLSDYLDSTVGFRPKYMRFPGGSSNTISANYSEGIMTRLTKSVTDKGYLYYDWNVDSGDASGNKVPTQRLVSNVKNRLGHTENAMLLMHDTSVKTTTVEALPQIIEFLQSKGYRLLPIDDTTVAPHHKINN